MSAVFSASRLTHRLVCERPVPPLFPQHLIFPSRTHITTILRFTTFLNWNSRFQNVPRSVYAARVLTVSPTIVTVNFHLIIASPRGAVRTYFRLLGNFRGQSKISSDNTQR